MNFANVDPKDLHFSEFSEKFSLIGLDDQGRETVKNVTKAHIIKTDKRVPKLGVMLVGIGGNNGSTFLAGILANKNNVTWETKNGIQTPNFYGSFTQCATVHVGFTHNEETGELEDVYKPVKELLPMVNPVDIVISGWDISSKNLYESCRRAQVLEPDLID